MYSQEKKEVFGDEQKMGFQKFANNLLKRNYPFISKIEFVTFPYTDNYDFVFKLDIFVDFNYLINSERILRHIDKSELEFRKKRGQIISDWETRLFFHPFSSHELSNQIQELAALMTGKSEINKLYNISNITFLIDPSTHVT